MADFRQTLYEALLVAFGKTLAKHNAFAQSAILEDVGKEILEYLHTHGFAIAETGDIADLQRLTDLFVDNGFAESLTVEDADPGATYTWKGLYGIEAYHALHEVAENPFLSCPLNLCLYYLAHKLNKTMRLHRKTFDMPRRTSVAQYEIVDAEPSAEGQVDPLVIENARLYQLALERAERLERAQREIKMLRGIIPICCSCKKVRTDDGFWQQVEAYVTEHSEAMFTHGYCPDCRNRLFPRSKDPSKDPG